ncbi:hypothetical protein [Methylobacterium radiotolerans]|uniref:Uncharacterized protein n=1 Tax=Methylobacterium radiotolerans (strain ATCC 27329 / DSM 1819 / JCM 2831 / NBRC 15690 / NCIMB 10815 / 0-1) TaxID=426355 RepID=B1LW67_METRJ|nr:hypothetical protein [Methylobacterium radiotolerans]ACB27130.1 hypothetical protein Mrad2831_5173 [Methylobacterium radiotolerans JCM 2831]GEN00236.1 hypothetical protein MRA01_47750 [Methylobacterium radiotolerans]
MTLAELDALDVADRAPAGRLVEVMASPEAKPEGRRLLAFGLALRFDLSPDAVRLLLREAPVLRSADDVIRWIGTIPVCLNGGTRH